MAKRKPAKRRRKNVQEEEEQVSSSDEDLSSEEVEESEESEGEESEESEGEESEDDEEEEGEEAKEGGVKAETKGGSVNWGVWDDAHRLLLQTFLHRGTMKQDELVNIVKAKSASCFNEEEDVSPDYTAEMETAVEKINTRLQKYGMQMVLKRRKMVELNGQVYWVLASEGDDEISKKMTTMEPWVPSFCKKLMELVVSSDDGYFTNTDAIHEAAKEPLKKSASAAEAAVSQLVEHHWLWEGKKKGYYTAGPRTLVELEPLLHDLGAPRCNVSMSTVVKTNRYKAWRAEQPVR